MVPRPVTVAAPHPRPSGVFPPFGWRPSADKEEEGEILCARRGCQNRVGAAERKYCSRECAVEATRKEPRRCPICRNRMTRKQSWGGQETCSRECGHVLSAMRGRGPHDEAFKQRVYTLRQAGTTQTEIARQLGVTKNVVVGICGRARKAGLIGLVSTPQTEKLLQRKKTVSGYSNPPKKPKLPQRSQYQDTVVQRGTVTSYPVDNSSPHRETLTPPHVTHPVLARVDAARVKRTSPVHVVGTPGNGCQYPISSNPWRICDDPRVPNQTRPGVSAYCAAHYQLCFVRVPYRGDAA